MNRFRIFLALTAMGTGLFLPGAQLEAYRYSTDTGGCGYCECRSCVVIAPAVALALVALAGIIAVALQTNNTEHTH